MSAQPPTLPQCLLHGFRRWTIIVVTTTDETLPDDLNELGQPFHRGENSRISAVPGVGLGLSIAQAATGAMMLRHPIMSPPHTIASTTR
ncbi:MAG: ATP-binding protein [Bifidobacterium scardovii]|uniref:ATP-binding protein n=1 Tax=Bifidobacterium scardovii TaxID=158787 RepID=UPI0006678BE1|nr:ATP-binding protein [Bifidobacterium scardovii]MDU3736103.1 ATP-binding protein [Bifidobacterium scardovii]MDU5297774.1 ATP-binding protein [Bifidobacterium scardovii]MDU5610137.1 ATP-binding protein [Bifidobacterium scardovii]MDU5887379.1 ATP-binding protein [Bifidobacterium scardovii]MDU6282076.1 ATP-binding protein [Bifidobacterium scardovii]